MSRRRILVRLLLAAALLGGVAAVPAGSPAASDGPAGDGGALPVVSPTPQSISRVGPDLRVPDRVRVVTGADTDPVALEELRGALRDAGADRIDAGTRASTGTGGGSARLTVLLGAASRADIASALAGTPVPERAEGYALRVGQSAVALGGADATGQFYAVKTLSQLIRGGTIAGASVSDYPSMPLRGTIEGFYGPTWTAAERLDHLDFLGDTKANTYVYAPKADPYHRERWREPYPADRLAELERLVDRARANHVRFTFALSPGASICYSDPADAAAVTDKFQQLYEIGVRSFSIPLDDISYTQWNCEGDHSAYGEPGPGPAASAQVGLLNAVRRDFVATHDGTRPLQMVPTEYGNLTDTAYKRTIRESLDPDVEVMWTGTETVPPEITTEQAADAAELFGRKVFVWDNYPVNDYGESTGRLLLAPYDRREPGLSEHLSGIVSNPMNQAAASKLAVFTMNDFSWNDRGFDRAVSGRQAALYVAGGDERVADAVQVFVDLNHAAPMFGGELWQPQAPVFGEQVERFWRTWEDDWRAAARELRPVLRGIEQAPEVIRAGVEDELLLSDADSWLDATQLWGRALGDGLDALVAIRSGDEAKAEAERASMDALVERIGTITVDPAENQHVGPVLIGDPHTYDFVFDVGNAHDVSRGMPPLAEVARGGEASQVSDYACTWCDPGEEFAYTAARSNDGLLFNFSTTAGTEPQPWWQVDLGAATSVEEVRVYNRADCCAERVTDFHVLVSPQPFTGTLEENLAKPGVTHVHHAGQAGRPSVVAFPGVPGRYVRIWLATAENTELNMAEVQVYGRG
jgi:hyaluronoglucosaminidase